jgi:hypothetical protein
MLHLAFALAHWGLRRSIASTAFPAIVLAVLMTAFCSQPSWALDVTLAWDPSSPNVTGYKLYWGTSSGVYPNDKKVGNGTRAIISGLVAEQIYFFAATAYLSYNGVDYESAFSNDVFGEPLPDSNQHIYLLLFGYRNELIDETAIGCFSWRGCDHAPPCSRVGALEAATFSCPDSVPCHGPRRTPDPAVQPLLLGRDRDFGPGPQQWTQYCGL